MSDEFEEMPWDSFYSDPPPPTFKRTRMDRIREWRDGWFWTEPLDCWGGPVIWCIGLGFWTLVWWRGQPSNKIKWLIELNID